MLSFTNIFTVKTKKNWKEGNNVQRIIFFCWCQPVWCAYLLLLLLSTEQEIV